MTRRDILKTALLAPFAAIVPAAPGPVPPEVISVVEDLYRALGALKVARPYYDFTGQLLYSEATP